MFDQNLLFLGPNSACCGAPEVVEVTSITSSEVSHCGISLENDEDFKGIPSGLTVCELENHHC